jgi:hypothetical protein
MTLAAFAVVALLLAAIDPLAKLDGLLRRGRQWAVESGATPSRFARFVRACADWLLPVVGFFMMFRPLTEAEKEKRFQVKARVGQPDKKDDAMYQQLCLHFEQRVLPELRQQLMDELRQQLLPELKQQQQLLDELKQRMDELRQQLLPELKQQLLDELKQRMDELRQALPELPQQILDELRQPLLDELRQPLLDELRQQLLPEVTQQLSGRAEAASSARA